MDACGRLWMLPDKGGEHLPVILFLDFALPLIYYIGKRISTA